ncbi:hypothetical protein ACQP1W_46410 [Spirillospora sp. CA-255316]
MWRELIGRLYGDAEFAAPASDGGRPDEVWVWDHETDERTSVAPSLEDYLRRRADAGGDDWYGHDGHSSA